jgi:hypothetical protein
MLLKIDEHTFRANSFHCQHVTRVSPSKYTIMAKCVGFVPIYNIFARNTKRTTGLAGGDVFLRP